MDLYIMRHGAAEERGAQWPDDAQRPLTEDGRRKAREVAQGLAAEGVALDAVFTSPLVRARETAEIVAKELGLSAKLRETKNLAPGADPEALLGELRASAPAAVGLMVVGHEPDLGMLVSRLLTGDPSLVDAPMKKAGVARIEVDALPPGRRGTLRWVLGPGQLRAIGRGRTG
jgi:phosphohistidine phosphatase